MKKLISLSTVFIYIFFVATFYSCEKEESEISKNENPFIEDSNLNNLVRLSIKDNLLANLHFRRVIDTGELTIIFNKLKVTEYDLARKGLFLETDIDVFLDYIINNYAGTGLDLYFQEISSSMEKLANTISFYKMNYSEEDIESKLVEAIKIITKKYCQENFVVSRNPECDECYDDYENCEEVCKI